MGIIKRKSKESMTKDDQKADSLPIALGVQRKNQKMKPSAMMADGGEVAEKKTLGQTIGYPGSDPKPKPIKMAEGGEVEEHYESIADAILAKRRRANEMAEAPSILEEQNEDAMHPSMDDIESQPEDSNEHSDSIDEDKHDMVGAIRRKMASKRGR